MGGIAVVLILSCDSASISFTILQALVPVLCYRVCMCQMHALMTTNLSHHRAKLIWRLLGNGIKSQHSSKGTWISIGFGMFNVHCTNSDCICQYSKMRHRSGSVRTGWETSVPYWELGIPTGPSHTDPRNLRDFLVIPRRLPWHA